jgi:zinc/manganese transport system substrate-binding protein
VLVRTLLGLRLWLALLALLVAGGCAGPAAEAEPPLVVATTTIVGDLTARVAGDEAVVEVLMPTGADPCAFEPTSEQASRLLEADLIVSSGLGLEVGLADALGEAELCGVEVLRLGEELHPRHLGHDTREALDPYWWMDPLRAAGAVTLIADRLRTVCDGGWITRALVAEQDLCALDVELRDVLWRRDPGPRYLLTEQPGLAYFAERYDCIIGHPDPVFVEPLGPSSVTPVRTQADDEPLPAGVSRMPGTEPRVERVSRVDPVAVKVALGPSPTRVALFIDSLGEPGSGAETYGDMMLTNADRIAHAGSTVIVQRTHTDA